MRDDLTKIPRKLKRRWEARDKLLLVLGWLLMIGVFLYAVGHFAERYSAKYPIDWP